MSVDRDPLTKGIMATLADVGFIVAIGRDHAGRNVASARDAAGEAWQVWTADAYAAVCELVRRMGDADARLTVSVRSTSGFYGR